MRMPHTWVAPTPTPHHAGANSDVSMADLRGSGKHAHHPLNIKKETWQEVRAGEGREAGGGLPLFCSQERAGLCVDAPPLQPGRHTPAMSASSLPARGPLPLSRPCCRPLGAT